jgi:multiple sugar transport system substrate-binding protein
MLHICQTLPLVLRPDQVENRTAANTSSGDAGHKGEIMLKQNRWMKVLSLLFVLSMIAAACGSDSSDVDVTPATEAPESEPDTALQDELAAAQAELEELQANADASEAEIAEAQARAEEAETAAEANALPYGLTPGKPYEGTELTFLICCEGAAQFQVWRASRPEFERLTGISVEFTDDPLGGLKDKIVTESVSNPGSWDATILFDTWLPELANFLEPLDDSVVADVDLADFPGATSDLGQWDGAQYGVPVRSHVMMFYYRQDVFEELGIDVPTTFDELVAAAEAVEAANPDMAGFVVNWGRQSSISPMPWQQLLVNAGGSLFDDAANPTAAAFNTPEGIAATELYQSLLDVGPDGAAAFNEADMRNSFAAGDAAMALAWSWSMEVFANPDAAAEDVLGNVGFTSAIPGLDAAGDPLAMAWPMGISKSSENKEAAAEWIRWMTNPDLDAQAITEKSVLSQATVVGNRLSSLTSEGANEANSGFSQAMADAYSNASHQPIYRDFSTVTEIIETMLSEVVAGADVVEALAAGEAELNDALAG